MRELTPFVPTLYRRPEDDLETLEVLSKAGIDFVDVQNAAGMNGVPALTTLLGTFWGIEAIKGYARIPYSTIDRLEETRRTLPPG